MPRTNHFCFFCSPKDIDEPCGIKPSEVVWLEEIQPPENLVVQRGLYRGPVIRSWSGLPSTTAASNCWDVGHNCCHSHWEAFDCTYRLSWLGDQKFFPMLWLFLYCNKCPDTRLAARFWPPCEVFCSVNTSLLECYLWFMPLLQLFSGVPSVNRYNCWKEENWQACIITTYPILPEKLHPFCCLTTESSIIQQESTVPKIKKVLRNSRN